RTCFPVRAEFFYDHPLGLLLNVALTGMAMFPPVFRHGRRRALNAWSRARCARELARPRTAVGVHPEGRRNKDGGPFEMLPAMPGAGRIALAAPGAPVVPVFIHGLGNSVA